MKIDAKIFKGIEYIQINELPAAQAERLSQTVNPDLFIKLLIDGKIIGGCLQYKDYSAWYQNNYSEVNPTNGQTAVPSVGVTKLELKNI